MKNYFRGILSYLPEQWQLILKQMSFMLRIKTGRFTTNEPEFTWVDHVVRPGDTCIDIGASVGVYTHKLAKLVGVAGRVYSFEPVPESFSFLTAHVSLCCHKNVTLLNMAASDKTEIVQMVVPRSNDRLKNYYRAHIVNGKSATTTDLIQIFCCPLSALDFPTPIRLVKIDAEGHEKAVLSGMESLIKRDHPILIIETNSHEISEWLAQYSYREIHLPFSPNRIFHFEEITV